MRYRFLHGFVMMASVCAWAQTAPSQPPDAPSPQTQATDSQSSSQSNNQSQDSQSQDEKKKKESWLHKRLGRWCVQGMKCWGEEQDQQDQKDQQPPAQSPVPANQAPPRSDEDTHAGPGDSSSRETAPTAPEATPDSSTEVNEFHPWDPHKAAKNVEVGDFYFKKQNYRAAISRYCEALTYKSDDAVATFRLATALEKAGDLAGAQAYYQWYLKILPEGPFAADSKKALERIKAQPQPADKHLAPQSGCEAPGSFAQRREPADPDRPTLTRRPTSQPSGKSQ